MRIVLCYPATDQHAEQIRSVAGAAEVFRATQDNIVDQIHDADVFCGHAKQHPIDWERVVKQGRLQWIQSSAAGLDHCLTPAVTASSILVTSASSLFAVQVAEHAMALLLALVRSLPTFFEAQRRREFERRPTGDLHGKTVGIVGLGGNGRRLAQVLSAFGVRIVATDWFPTQKPSDVDELWPAEEVDRLLKQSDIVVLCVPLTASTRGMIGARELALLKPGAILINVARGTIVQESPLVQALQTGRLAAAGLDVTEVEPLPDDSPLWSLPSVLITPHVGAQAADRYDVVTRLFCHNLEKYLAGEPMINLVDKSLGFPRPEHRLQ